MNPLREAAQRRLQLMLGLSAEQAERAVAEVLDTMSLEVDAFITTRHGELQAQGVSNNDIYDLIAAELAELRFQAPVLTARQIRRRIYG